MRPGGFWRVRWESHSLRATRCRIRRFHDRQAHLLRKTRDGDFLVCAKMPLRKLDIAMRPKTNTICRPGIMNDELISKVPV